MKKEEKLYFDWICSIVTQDSGSDRSNFYKLLEELYSADFRYSLAIPNDINRYHDGMVMRKRYSDHSGIHIYDSLCQKNCSILEMMVALAVRIEESIMGNDEYGDRTSQWFWTMIRSLGLGGMSDNEFDQKKVREAINIFLRREYKPNGSGGLFTIRNNSDDLRGVEIWVQMLWYLNSIS